MDGKEKPFPKARRSASADAALRAEIRRVGKMTMEQRMSAALSMGRGLSGVQNPQADLRLIRETCRRYRMRGWETVLAELLPEGAP